MITVKRPMGGNTIEIGVKVGENTYGVRADDSALDTAIETLLEAIMNAEIGITKFDIVQKVFAL